jgi:hypothetical protein
METTKPTKFHEKVKSGSLGGGFVGFDCFVGFRVFRGFLDGGVDRYGAKAAEGRKGRWSFGVSEAALLKKLCVSAALREVFFPLTVDGSRWESMGVDGSRWESMGGIFACQLAALHGRRGVG